jgi:hypothetical protein
MNTSALHCPSSSCAAAISLLLCASALADTASDEKNLLDVDFTYLSNNGEEIFRQEAGRWNFNFRPYGSSAGLLWADPIVQRNAAAGNAGDKVMTGLDVVCNEEGFSILVLCYDPALADYAAKTNDFPAPSIELYFLPGDFDAPKIEHHYQLYIGKLASSLAEFSWLVEGPDFRPIKPFTVMHDYVLKEGAVLRRYDISWEPLFDRLPFTDKRDNLWRLSVCRWAPGGGQTWGGPVHQPAQAGYIRFPDFTPAQRTAIMESLLRKAWISFRSRSGKRDMVCSANTWNSPQVRTEKFFLEETAEAPRSYVNYNEDPGFRPILEKLQAERMALAPTIGAFATLPPDEQLAFYEKASKMLFNYEYDVQAAYARYATDQRFAAPVKP